MHRVGHSGHSIVIVVWMNLAKLHKKTILRQPSRLIWYIHAIMSLELGRLAIVIPIKYQDLEGYFLCMQQLPHAETVMDTSPTQTLPPTPPHNPSTIQTYQSLDFILQLLVVLLSSYHCISKCFKLSLHLGNIIAIQTLLKMWHMLGQ